VATKRKSPRVKTKNKITQHTTTATKRELETGGGGGGGGRGRTIRRTQVAAEESDSRGIVLLKSKTDRTNNDLSDRAGNREGREEIDVLRGVRSDRLRPRIDRSLDGSSMAFGIRREGEGRKGGPAMIGGARGRMKKRIDVVATSTKLFSLPL